MIIKPTPTKELMRTITDKTDKSISTPAVYVMVQKVEEFIKKKTKEALKLLDEENRLRKIQGLDEKKRINEEIIKQVMEDRSRAV